MKPIKYSIYFVLFFTLFYLENLQITPTFSFSHLWKIPLILVMVCNIIVHKLNSRPNFNKAAYLVGGTNLLNYGLFSSPLTNLVEFFRFTNFALLYDTLNIYIKNPVKLQNFIIRIAQYFILSSIPFLFGFLPSPKKGIEFENFNAFTGIFQNEHAASICTTLSLLIIIYYTKQYRISSISRFFNYAIVVLGIYILYLTYVRTGYLMFVLGIVIMYFPQKIRLKQIVIFSTTILLLSLSFNYLIKNNDSFRHRIFDQNKKGEQLNLGSGRLIFASYSLNYWAEGDIYEMVFGRGLDNVKDNLKAKTGLRIFSHNGFVDALAVNGLIGFTSFLAYLLFIFKTILKNKNLKTYKLVLSIFACYLSFQITQGGTIFIVDLFMASVLFLMKKDRALILNKSRKRALILSSTNQPAQLTFR